ncbi:MAG: UDP-N-acetylglucosamine acyltransferase [bacterium]|jgi:UDP-N-acetylglucosamine acyltransferase
MGNIHPTAIVDPKAKLHSSVIVGPYSIIGADVELGEDVEIRNNVTIEGPIIIGARTRIFPYASVGLEPQDKKFHNEKSSTEIGEDCTIRECVTINRGTEGGISKTILGDRAWVMAYCHVAHDCIVGNDVVLANATTLAGHVTIGNKVTLGGFTAIHQFCRVGDYTITGGQTVLRQDVVPFATASGSRAKISGINKIGLSRNGFSKEQIQEVQRIFRIFFRSGLRKVEAVAKIQEEFSNSVEAKQFLDFVESSERGITR